MTEIPLSKQDVIAFIQRYSAVKCYFLTITIKPKFYEFSSVTQLELTNDIVYGILYSCVNDFICVAEHTKNGNVHYHAVITFEEKSRGVLLLNKLKKQRELGFIKLDAQSIQSIEATAEYLTKDLYDSMKVFTSVKGHKPRWYMTNALWRHLIN